MLLAQSNMVRGHCVLCQVSDVHLMVSASKCLTADVGTCNMFAHLSSSAPNRGKLIQASISEGWTKWHYQAEPYAYCYKLGSELLQVIQMQSIWGRRVQ